MCFTSSGDRSDKDRGVKVTTGTGGGGLLMGASSLDAGMEDQCELTPGGEGSWSVRASCICPVAATCRDQRATHRRSNTET